MDQKKYDLEERTFFFARDCRFLVKKIKMDVCSIEDCKQLVRASGSVGANYIEANESLRKKIFAVELKFAERNQKSRNIG